MIIITFCAQKCMLGISIENRRLISGIWLLKSILEIFMKIVDDYREFCVQKYMLEISVENLQQFSMAISSKIYTGNFDDIMEDFR